MADFVPKFEFVEKKYNDGHLPYMLRHPTKREIVWVCDRDEDGKITSLYIYSPLGETPERRGNYLATRKEADDTYQVLRLNGWEHISPPKIEIRDHDGNVVSKSV